MYKGSVEALKTASLLKIDVEGVRVNVVHSAVGAIQQIYYSCGSFRCRCPSGFNVRPPPARQQAEASELKFVFTASIYKVIEEIRRCHERMLDPKFEEKSWVKLLSVKTFKVSKSQEQSGGFMVTSGKITRDSSARVIRDGVVIFDE